MSAINVEKESSDVIGESSPAAAKDEEYELTAVEISIPGEEAKSPNSQHKNETIPPNSQSKNDTIPVSSSGRLESNFSNSYPEPTHTSPNPTHSIPNPYHVTEEKTLECGLLSLRPQFIQPLANVKVFVFVLSMLILVQQALASGYLNSVITTIEKRYEIPSYVTGLICSMYEIGNVTTVLFVSYLGSSRCFFFFDKLKTILFLINRKILIFFYV